MRELIWNKYSRTAIPEYLFYSCSILILEGKKKKKKRASRQISYFPPACPLTSPKPSSGSPTYRNAQPAFHAFSVQGATAPPPLPIQVSLTRDFKMQHSTIPGTILQPKNSGNLMIKHSLYLRFWREVFFLANFHQFGSQPICLQWQRPLGSLNGIYY